MMMLQRLLWLAVLLLTATAHAEPLASEDIYVVDGDTITVDTRPENSPRGV